MIRVAILTHDPHMGAGIQEMIENSGVFRVVVTTSSRDPVPEIIRAIRTHNPEITLLDITDWNPVATLAKSMKSLAISGAVVGFAYDFTRPERMMAEEAGIAALLRAPFLSNSIGTPLVSSRVFSLDRASRSFSRSAEPAFCSASLRI